MTFAELSSVNASNDVGALLVYANDLTGGILMPMILAAFFLIALIGSYLAQLRFGRDSLPISFASASFVTFGMCTMMTFETGLINPIYLFITIGLSIIGVIWLYMSSES